MIIPEKLKKGDKIAIVSLSSGLLGEPFMEYQKTLIEKRLNEYGLEVIYTPNALKGIEYIKEHPEKRAEDLKWAFKNPEIKAIITAIGGDDTYRTVPYLLDDEEFKELVRNNSKIFIGYSDTTINHLMFYKLGLRTYYGHAAIVDMGELGTNMLPYAKLWFQKLFTIEENIEITSSPVWYMERTTFAESENGKDRITKEETKGYEVLHGTGMVEGTLFGGCIESLSELISGDRYSDEPEVNEKYNLFPENKDLEGKVFFLESSEEKPSPERLIQLLKVLEEKGVFNVVNAVLVGKPQDEAYYEEYKQIYTDLAKKYNKPIIFNLNFGHAHPKCILPYGANVTLDLDNKKIIINDSLTKADQQIKTK